MHVIVKKKDTFLVHCNKKKMRKQLENKCFNLIMDVWESRDNQPFESLRVDLDIQLDQEMYLLLKDRLWNDFGMLMLLPDSEKNFCRDPSETKVNVWRNQLTDSELKVFPSEEWQHLTKICRQRDQNQLKCLFVEYLKKSDPFQARILLSYLKQTKMAANLRMKNGILQV